jgi:type IV secretion system protein TrbG
MNRFLLSPITCLSGFALCAAAPPMVTPPMAPVTPKPPITATSIAPAVVTAPTAIRPPKKRHRAKIPTSSALRHVDIANRAATREPVLPAFINAVQIYPYADGAVYHVYTAPERVTDITLQPGEILGAVASGDTVRWVVGDTTSGSGADKRTHILVKPFAAGLTTNLVITTDRRSYHLALTSTARTAMAALSWTYPQDALIALNHVKNEAEAAIPVATGLAVDRLRFDYTISGDRPSWRPARAFDDGRQTYIEFPADIAVGEAPPLFLVDGKGEAQLVNYRARGRYYVVDRLFDVAELRLGTKHQNIVRIVRGGASKRRAS